MKKVDNHFDEINTQGSCIPSLQSYPLYRWKLPSLMVSDSATVGMDDVVHADSQRSNAGDVKKSDNHFNLTNACGVCTPSIQYCVKNYEPPSLINKPQFHSSW